MFLAMPPLLLMPSSVDSLSTANRMVRRLQKMNQTEVVQCNNYKSTLLQYCLTIVNQGNKSVTVFLEAVTLFWRLFTFGIVISSYANSSTLYPCQSLSRLVGCSFVLA